ncbi:MAG: YaiI/YqxD family protein [Spirochaetaceae bacterium]|nr:YaiI/YqxD family protein [Spirochaetaceae bacterium]
MSLPFSIWVDADSCPVDVRQIIIRFAKRLELKTYFVANHPIPSPKSELFEMIIADATPDAADNIIVEKINPDDIAITRDIPLASRLVEKQITVINDRGTLFTAENIREKLSIRDFNKTLYENGLISEKNTSFGKKEANLFANCFDREIQKKLRGNLNIRQRQGTDALRHP